MKKSTKAKGFILGAIAAATYGMNPLFALPLYAEGLHADSVLFYRYIFALPILAIMIKMRGQSFKLKRNEILPLIIIGFLFSSSSLFLFMSYNHMDAGIASTILFVYPIMVAVIMAICFKERLNLLTIACILLALSGIAMLYEGDGGETLSTIGICFVMISALTYSIYIVAVNRSVLKDIPTVKLTFYAILFGSLLFVVRLRFGLDLEPIHTWYHWGNVLALAILPTIVSLTCTTQAIHYIGSTITAILGALEPVTAVIIGVLVFHEHLTQRLILGIIMIISAVTIIVAAGEINTYLLRFRKLFPSLKNKRKSNKTLNDKVNN